MSGWHGVLEALVVERRADLIGYASLYAVDRTAAEDLVHEALVRSFSRNRNVRTIQAAELYVRRAIRTSFLDQARRRRTRQAKAHLLASPAMTAGPEDRVEAQIDVRAALAALTPRERACVVLRFFDDLPAAEIAAELGVSEGAVKRYLSDGTAKLRVVLAEPDLDDGSESIRVLESEARRQS